MVVSVSDPKASISIRNVTVFFLYTEVGSLRTIGPNGEEVIRLLEDYKGIFGTRSGLVMQNCSWLILTNPFIVLCNIYN